MSRSVCLRLGLAVAGVMAAALALFPRDAQAWLRGMTHEGQVMQALMTTSWMAFGAGQVAVAASGLLPASLIAVMAGASFGFGWGMALSIASTMLGGWASFLLSRSLLRRFIERLVRRHPAMGRLDQGMTQEGWRLVMLLRVSPVMPFAMTSYGLGLTRIAQRDFLLGTLASLPALAGYVAVGAMGRQGLALADDGAGPWHWAAMVLGFAVIVYALSRLRRTMTRIAAA